MELWHHCGNCNEVTLRRVRLVLGWVTVFGWTNHLGLEPATQANSASYPTVLGTGNEFWPKCGDAVQLGSKSRHGTLAMMVAWHSGNVVGRVLYVGPGLYWDG